MNRGGGKELVVIATDESENQSEMAACQLGKSAIDKMADLRPNGHFDLGEIFSPNTQFFSKWPFGPFAKRTLILFVRSFSLRK